jgi:hypothetical protein
MPSDHVSIADLLGPWVPQEYDSGLIERCRKAWDKPLRELSREELATFLRQRIAVEHLLPIAKLRISEGMDDDTEMYEGELKEAILSASEKN